MTDEEILATADACGLMLFGLGLDKAKFEFCILAFAKQIAKLERYHEREACAKVCDELAEHLRLHKDFDGAQIAASLSFDIRARGEA
jgi:hypothetical protein